MVGHMIDVTEGYLTAWDMTRKGESSDALGLVVMSDRLNQHAQAFRSLPRAEAIARLKRDSDEAFVIFEALTPEEWMGSWSSILCVKFSSDFLTPFPVGISSLSEPGIEPWKMYFSSGIFLKTCGLSPKFSPSTDLGVCLSQSVRRKVDSSEKPPSSKMSRNSVPLGPRPCKL